MVNPFKQKIYTKKILLNISIFITLPLIIYYVNSCKKEFHYTHTYKSCQNIDTVRKEISA